VERVDFFNAQQHIIKMVDLVEEPDKIVTKDQDLQ
jgi:hypothetical protein